MVKTIKGDSMQAQTYWISTQDKQKLYAKTWGNAENPALVLVHGYPDNQEVWEPIIAQLISQFYIVTYDVRGAGQSSIPKRIRDYALPRLSLDLECVVNELLPERQFHLAAHDWGSIQSWESVTETKFKNRILSYTTMSGPCLDHAAFWMREQFLHEKPKFFKQLLKSWYIVAFQLPILARRRGGGVLHRLRGRRVAGRVGAADRGRHLHQDRGHRRRPDEDRVQDQGGRRPQPRRDRGLHR
jgi:pimeloyl-ACP methyl ester carboxylesterase